MSARPFTYGSVCSGIEAATKAWRPLGWQAQFFSEIEAFPSAVLAHHYGSNMPGEPPARNGIPNYGDFTKIGTGAGPVDLLVGGTPCQSFSIAGKRLGLDDPRGNLALEYLALAKRLGARWILWENVPGVLSSFSGSPDHGGEPRPGDRWREDHDFATFLSYVRECGYGFAWRVLDAQYVRSDGYERAVAQRRRRVFLVGYLGDFRPAAAVLFDPEGLRGDHPPRRKAGQGLAGDVAPSLVSSGRGVERAGETRGQDPVVAVNRGVSATVSSKWAKGTGGPAGDEAQNLVATPVAAAITRNPYGDHESRESLLVAHSLRGEGFDASEDGTGRGTPIVPVAFSSKDYGADASDDVSPTLRSMHHDQSHPNAGGQVTVAFDMRGREGGAMPEGPHDTANIRAASGGSSRSYVATDWAVRRLTPRECERLQGFEDDFTAIPWRGKSAGACPDGPRYRALGNSMAVNVMRWIGERIHIFETKVRPALDAADNPERQST